MSLSPAAGAAVHAVTTTAWIYLIQDLGDPALEGSFTLTDANIGADSLVTVVSGSLPSPRADEATMDPIFCVAVPSAGQATIYWTTLGQGLVEGDAAFLYTIA